MRRVAIAALVACFALPGAARAQGSSTSISGQWYLNYRAGKSGGETFNRFGIDRAYVNIRHTLTDRWSGRITTDMTLDQFGDAKVRLKYAYADLKLPDQGLFTSNHVEMGLVHRPWLDYEEHVNLYRNQGTMFLERNHLFNSADYGVTFFTLLGGKVSEEYQREVSSAYPGRFGSITVGVYNGGGYHAAEKNENKSFEGRVSVRPFPEVFPGFQLTYLGIVGKGNKEDGENWVNNSVFASLETPDVVLTAQGYWGEGNSGGSAVNPFGGALDQDGFSLFGELKLHGPGMSLIGRYDRFNAGEEKSERVIGGVAYHIKGHSKVLLDYDMESPDGFDTIRYRVLKLSLEYSF